MQRIVYHLMISFIIVTILTTVSSFSHSQTNQTETTSQRQQEPNDQTGDFRWVSDELFTYLRSGPGKNYRLLGSVNAGTKVQLLQTNYAAGFAEIIDDKQRTGWIEIEFLSDVKSIRDNLSEVESQLSIKTESLQSVQTKLQSASQNLAKSDDQNTKLNRLVTQQFEDISRLKEEVKNSENTNNIRWFTRGSIVGISALLIGYVLGLLGRKRNASDHYR